MDSPRKKIPKPPDFKPEPTFPKGHAWEGQPRCQAWNSNHGRQCMKRPAKGRRVCKKDGGATPRGAASPHWKTGQYSKDLQTHAAFLADYESALNSKQLLELNDNIALIDAMIREQIREMDSTSSREIWSKVKKSFTMMKNAAFTGDETGFQSHLDQLASHINLGLKKSVGQDRVVSLSKDKMRLVESERKRAVESHQAMTREVALSLFALVVQSYRESIIKACDKKQARLILTEAGGKIDKLIQGNALSTTDVQ